MRANTTYLLAAGVIVVAISISTACTPQAPVAPQQPTVARGQAPAAAEKAPDASKPAEITDQMKDILAKADLADGTADKIVSKCAACDLAMDGSKEHALTVGQYTLLFCSEECKQGFAKDLEKSVLGIKLPQTAAR
ncbi:MAG: hypothetical protein ACLQNE_43280 [Thermoguttaceae bacterium]